MSDQPIQCPASRHRAAARRILGEAVLVTVAGVVFALAANQVSPLGLKLGRNYFPGGMARPLGPPPAGGTLTNPVGGASGPPVSIAQLLAARMKELGLQLIDGHRAQELFHDPRRSDGALIFVDARDAERYREGHIPGAYEFDPYHPEKYLDAVLPVCQKAEQIVVYCNGGDCDDSESAALSLRDDGVANQKLFIYGGGMTEWTTNGWPIEKDGRNGKDSSAPAK
ncbi:MAG: rhodanese-like domain-containing protein [Verrucomicrobiota bacterium]